MIFEFLCFVGLKAVHWQYHVYVPSCQIFPSEKQKQYILNFVNKKSWPFHHPIYGWIMNRGQDVNSQYIRSLHEISTVPQPNRLRISAFGDSYTFSPLVPFVNSWLAKLESLDRQIETVNFGVGGYGLDQAYLRYLHEGRNFHSDVVFIGYYAYDISRHLSVFLPFRTDGVDVALAKPRFVLQRGQLILRDNPLPDSRGYLQLLYEPVKIFKESGRGTYSNDVFQLGGPLSILPSVRLWKITNRARSVIKNGMYDEKSEAFQLTVRIIEEFYNQVIRDGALPVLILFPSQRDIELQRSRRKSMYLPLTKYLERKNIKYFDAICAFPPDIPLEHLFRGNHYTAQGNGYVAKSAYEFMVSNGMLRSNRS